MNALLTGIFALGLLTACTSSEQKHVHETPVSLPPAAPAEIPQAKSTLHATIYVKKDGRIFLNRVLTELKTLDEKLKEYRNQHKDLVIFYSRDNRLQDPPETAMLAMDVIAKQGLPIQFYTDSTFSEVVAF